MNKTTTKLEFHVRFSVSLSTVLEGDTVGALESIENTVKPMHDINIIQVCTLSLRHSKQANVIMSSAFKFSSKCIG